MQSHGMHGTCPVVKVKAWGNSKDEFVEINESDYKANKDAYELYVEPGAEPAAKPAAPAAKPKK